MCTDFLGEFVRHLAYEYDEGNNLTKLKHIARDSVNSFTRENKISTTSNRGAPISMGTIWGALRWSWMKRDKHLLNIKEINSNIMKYFLMVDMCMILCYLQNQLQKVTMFVLIKSLMLLI